MKQFAAIFMFAMLLVGCEAPPPKSPSPTDAERVQKNLPPGASLPERQGDTWWWKSTIGGRSYLFYSKASNPTHPHRQFASPDTFIQVDR